MSGRHHVRAGCLAAAAVVLLATADGAAQPPRPKAASAPTSPQPVHVVVRGDTLSAIASRYGVTVTALVSANRLSGERALLRVGQRLVVPAVSASASANAPASAATSARRAPPAETRPARAPVPRGPRGLDLAVPVFVDASPPFIWPVEGYISSPYGRRRSGWHRGIDIKATPGSVVFAAAPGIVIVSAIEPRYGRVVKIEHDDGFLTVYAHNEENLVEVGMKVGLGDPIATIGRTGRATAHHLHFEIRRAGAVYNPLYLLPLPPQVSHAEDSGDETEEEHE